MSELWIWLCAKGKPVEGFVEQSNDDVHYMNWIFKGITAAIVLNIHSREQGKETETHEEAIAVIQVKGDGGSDHRGSSGGVRNYQLLNECILNSELEP